MKMRRIKQARCRPGVETEIDLHGYTQAEARELLLEFLDEAAECGYRRGRVVTGKGLHSPDGVGVIKELAETILRQRGCRFVEAEPAEGGSGALIVSFRP